MKICEIDPLDVSNQLIVDWRITLDCNLNCGFCTVKEREKIKNLNSRKDYLTTTEVIDISNHLSKMKSQRILLHFTGGEPFIRKDIIEKSPILRSLNLHLAIDTNGTLLDNQMRRTVLNYYEGITFSLDGLEDIHDAIRGKETFKTVFSNMEKLSIGRNESDSDLKINVNTAITNLLSINEVEELVQTLSSLGVDKIRFIPVLHNSFSSYQNYQPTFSDCKDILGFIYTLSKIYPQIEISKKYIQKIYQIFIWSNEKKINNLKYPVCGCGKEFFMIDAYGGVWPCCMFTQNNIKMGIDWKRAFELYKNNELSIAFRKMKRLYGRSCRTCIIPSLSEKDRDKKNIMNH